MVGYRGDLHVPAQVGHLRERRSVAGGPGFGLGGGGHASRISYHVELSFLPVTSVHFQVVVVTFRKFRLLPENLSTEQEVRGGAQPPAPPAGPGSAAHLQHPFRLLPLCTDVHVSPPTPLVVPNTIGHLPTNPGSGQCHLTGSQLCSEPTVMAFTLSKGLL